MRLLSAAARRELAGEETGEVFVFLLTITNVGLATPLRFVNDTADLSRTLVVDGFPVTETYLACPFSITMPEDREDQLGQVILAIDNIDRSIVAALRQIVGRVPAMTLELVRVSDPSTREAGLFRFRLVQGSYDSLVVQGTLAYEDLLNTTYPRFLFLPSTTPSLF